MGNCCGSQSAYDDDTPIATSNRPQRPQRPQRSRVKATGAGHTLGGTSVDAPAGVDPRTAAALAAEVCPYFPPFPPILYCEF